MKHIENLVTHRATPQFLKYLFVGGISALIELCTFQFLYLAASWDIFAANTVAITLSTTFNFLANRSFTFASTKKPIRSFLLYILLFCINASVTSLAIAWLVSIGWHTIIAKLFTMACVVCWNFVLYRKLIFI